MVVEFWNDPRVILFLLIGILVADNLWSIYLMLREIRSTRRVHEVPSLLSLYLSDETFREMRTYKLHKSWLYVVVTLVTVIVPGCLELYFGFYPFVWWLSNQCALADWMNHELVLSIIFATIINVYCVVKALPGQLYERFCIKRLVPRKVSPWYVRLLSFSVDVVVAFLGLVLTVVCIVYMVKFLGQYSFLGFYAVAVSLTLLLILVLPFIIDPLIGNRVELENSQLREELEVLTSFVGFPMKQVVVIKVRDPNIGSNAFFYGGCCLKRIVIFDTLLYNRGRSDTSSLPRSELGKGLRNNEVVAVVAHELGHWRYGHFYKMIFMFKTHLLLTLLLFAVLFYHGPIYQAVGFEQDLQPTMAGFIIIFGFVLTPYLTVSNCMLLALTRHFEYEADEFAYLLGYADSLRQALLRLYAENLAFPISDECYSLWRHTHPTIMHRLARLERLQAMRS